MMTWFGAQGVGQLLAAQKMGGVSPTVRTMVAAYKQREDVKVLLTLVGKKLTPKDAEVVAAIRARHDKYMIAGGT